MDTAIAKIQRVLTIRLHRGEDLMGSIHAACEAYNITAGVILSVVGSVHDAVFYDPRVDDSDPAGVAYGEPIRVEYPAEVLSANGEITHLADGSRSVHVHAIFASSDGKVFAHAS